MITPTPSPQGNPDPTSSLVSFLLWIAAILSGPAVVWWEKLEARRKRQDEVNVATLKQAVEQKKADQEIDTAQAATMKLTLEAAQQAIINYNAVLINLSSLTKEVSTNREEIEKHKSQINILTQDKSRLETENVNQKEQIAIQKEEITKQKYEIKELTARVVELEDTLNANHIKFPTRLPYDGPDRRNPDIGGAG